MIFARNAMRDEIDGPETAETSGRRRLWGPCRIVLFPFRSRRRVLPRRSKPSTRLAFRKAHDAVTAGHRV